MVTRVDMLTYEQEARLPEWLAEWTARRIAIGLPTEPADWVAFEEGVRRCYEYAGASLFRDVCGLELHASPTAFFTRNRLLHMSGSWAR